MRHSMRVGLSFGLTSGVITTLGLIVGLDASTHSRAVVVGGILVIAIADAMSDALGIHMSEESENKHTNKQIWMSSVCTFLSKFFVALSFILPFLLFGLSDAIIVSVCWGLVLLGFMNFYIAKIGKENVLRLISAHLLIAVIVIALSYVVGRFVSVLFSA